MLAQKHKMLCKPPKILKSNISHILNPNLTTNKFHYNLVHQDPSNNTKCTFQFLRNFQVWFNLILSEKIIQYSRTFEVASPNAMKPSPCTLPPSRAFQRHQEHDLKHPSLVDLITTKQKKKKKNKQTHR
jgi:hypothetical protein